MNIQKNFLCYISNWSLDALKMNRTVFLSVPEPDEDDLKETATAIAEELEDGLDIKYQTIFENLSKSYFLFKKKLLNQILILNSMEQEIFII